MSKIVDQISVDDFSRRWFALRTEADPQARSRRVAELWATNGSQVLVDPPQAVRDTAYRVGIPGASSLRCAVTMRSIVGMVSVADGTVAGSGYEVIALDDDGRILLDHQNIAPELNRVAVQREPVTGGGRVKLDRATVCLPIKDRRVARLLHRSRVRNRWRAG